MTAKHTPGPIGFEGEEKTGMSGSDFVMVADKLDRQRKAAPQMYEALGKLADAITAYDFASDDLDTLYLAILHARDDARAVLVEIERGDKPEPT